MDPALQNQLHLPLHRSQFQQLLDPALQNQLFLPLHKSQFQQLLNPALQNQRRVLQHQYQLQILPTPRVLHHPCQHPSQHQPSQPLLDRQRRVLLLPNQLRIRLSFLLVMMRGGQRENHSIGQIIVIGIIACAHARGQNHPNMQKIPKRPNYRPPKQERPRLERIGIGIGIRICARAHVNLLLYHHHHVTAAELILPNSVEHTKPIHCMIVSTVI
ncbi:hypothetical protein ACHAXH_007767 [Discostella pseudostelligera]